MQLDVVLGGQGGYYNRLIARTCQVQGGLIWKRVKLLKSISILRDAASRVRPSSKPSGGGDFLLELTGILTPFPKTLLDEIINRGLVCAHMHSIARTQNILTFMS